MGIRARQRGRAEARPRIVPDEMQLGDDGRAVEQGKHPIAGVVGRLGDGADIVDDVAGREAADPGVVDPGAVEGAGGEVEAPARAGEGDGLAGPDRSRRQIPAGGDVDLAGPGDLADHVVETGGGRAGDHHAVVHQGARQPVPGEGEGP